MVKIPVYLRDMYDAKHLVQIAESCRGDVDLLCGRYVVDAKSMLGVFSLPTFEQVEMGVGEEEAEFAREKTGKPESDSKINRYQSQNTF